MKMLIDDNVVPSIDQLKKIRLVVSDLDGTLLNEKKQLPPNFPNLVEQLANRNILFATASGRNWDSQKDLFQTGTEEMTFICDNGAFIVHKGKPFFISELQTDFWKAVVQKCSEYGPECGAIVCGTKGAYMIQNPVIQPVVNQFYSGVHYVNHFDTVDDQIFKVSVCYLKGTATSLFNDFSSCFSGQGNLVCTHPLFMDVMNPGINKGTGVRMLQQFLGFTAEQTLAFGDYDNDIEMLQTAEISYIMENAPLSMRQYSPYLAPSNEELGVITVLKDTLLGIEW